MSAPHPATHTPPPSPTHRGELSVVIYDHVDPPVDAKGVKRKAGRSAQPKKKQRHYLLEMENKLKTISTQELERMNFGTLHRLVKLSKRALWNKQAWCEVVECTREEAVNHKWGGWSSRQCGNCYFYLQSKHAVPFSEEEECLIEDHLCCCYMYGQPCKEALEGDMCDCMSHIEHGTYNVNLGVGELTFDNECYEGLVPAKWSATSEDKNRLIFSIEELHDEIDIVCIATGIAGNATSGMLEQLDSATRYLMKPEGEVKIMGVTYKSL